MRNNALLTRRRGAVIQNALVGDVQQIRSWLDRHSLSFRAVSHVTIVHSRLDDAADVVTRRCQTVRKGLALLFEARAAAAARDMPEAMSSFTQSERDRRR